MAPDTWPQDFTRKVRENVAGFLQEAFKTGGFLADTEFKKHAEAGKPFVVRLEEACASKELAHTSNDELKSQLIAAEVIVEGLSEKYRYMKQYTHESLPERIIANAHRALRELTAAIKGAVVDVILGRTVYCDEEETV